MALTYEEQLEIINCQSVGYVPADPQNPTTLNIRLAEYISIGAVTHAINFVDNHQVFDIVDAQGEPINSEAYGYLQKMLRFCDEVLNYERQNKKFILLSMIRNLVVLISLKTSFNFAQVTGASESAWEAFISNQMLGIFEKMAGVNRKEKQAYDNLP